MIDCISALKPRLLNWNIFVKSPQELKMLRMCVCVKNLRESWGMYRKRVFRNADSVDIDQAPGRRPILRKERYWIDKSHPRGILRSDLPVGRRFMTIAFFRRSRSAFVRVLFFINRLHSAQFSFIKLVRALFRAQRAQRQFRYRLIHLRSGSRSARADSELFPHRSLSSRCISMNTQVA